MKQILKILLGANGVSVWRFFRSGPKGFAYSSRQGFSASYRAACPALAALPEVEVGEILQERRPSVVLEVLRYEDGMLRSEEAVVLASLMVAEQPAAVLEIGTYMGHTTRLLARNLPTAIIHTVDLPEDFVAGSGGGDGLAKDDLHLIARRDVGREFRRDPMASQIIQHFHDTAAWDFRGIGRPAAFFIDGSHTYGYVKNDSEKCLAVAAPGAVFLWHDCDDLHPEVVRFLAEWRGAGRDIRRLRGTALAYWKYAG